MAEILCPDCNSLSAFTVDSRYHSDIQARRRRYECSRCAHRFTTYEITAGEYEKVRAMSIDVAHIDSVIAALRHIKVQFNGTGKN